MAIDVIGPGLGIILDHEDRGVLPNRRMADRFDDLADRVVVVGDVGTRRMGGRRGGRRMIVPHAEEHQRRHGAPSGDLSSIIWNSRCHSEKRLGESCLP